jgi:cytochrome P450
MPLDEPVDLIAEYALPLLIRLISALYGLPAHCSEQFPRLDIAMHTGPTSRTSRRAATASTRWHYN